MTEHPTLRCPGCERGSVDVDPTFDPFAEMGDRLTISCTCPNGHVWMAWSAGRSKVAGTPGWADNSPHRRLGEKTPGP